MLLAWLLAVATALAAVPVEALEAMLDRDVVVVRADGSEVPGQLVGVGEQTATVLKADGRVVSVPLGEIEALRGQTARAPSPPPVPEAAPPSTIADGGPRLTGARHGREEISLSDGMGFRSGKALRLYQFVDDRGGVYSQQEGWRLMGRGDEYKRRGRSPLRTALDVVTFGCAAGILVVMLDGSSTNDRVAGPLGIGGLGASIVGFTVTMNLQRKRGEEGLRLARQHYGPPSP